MKKLRRRSESGSESRGDDEWIESKKRSNSPARDEELGLRESSEGQVMQSNISSKSIVFHKGSTFVKDKIFQERFPEGKTTRGTDVLNSNLDDAYRALGGGVDERGGGLGRSKREKTKGDVISISGGCELGRRHHSSSRSRSGSHDERKGLARTRDLSTRKDGEKKTSESDISSDDSLSKSRRSRRARTRSSTDSSDRTRKKKYGHTNCPSKNNSEQRQRSVRHNRSSESSDSSRRNRTRSRSNSRDRTRSRGLRSTSRDNRGLRSTSGDNRRQRSSSRDSRGRRSPSRDNRQRWGASRNSRGRRSASRNSRGRRSASGGSRGRRSASRSSRGRRSTSPDITKRRN